MVVALLGGCEFITGALSPVDEADTDTDAAATRGESGPLPGSGTESSDTSASAPASGTTDDDAEPDGEAGEAESSNGNRDPTWADSGESGDGWGTTGGKPETFGGSCCEAGLGPTCEDPDVTECVCAIDPWCCEKEWDAICADLVEDAGCASCSDVGPTNTDPVSCCSPQEGPGCPMNDVALCVCQTDPYCCNMYWDGTCASEVELFGCGQCGTGDATTGVDPFGATDGDTDGTGPGSAESTGG